MAYLDVVHLFVFFIQSGDQEVVRDVVQVATELEPWTSSGNVVSGTFALDFDQDFGIDDILTVPNVERFQKLETVGFRVDNN